MYTLRTHEKYSYVNIVEIPRKNIKKIDFALCNQPTETPDAYYKRQDVKPDIITNGGFFSMTDGVTCFGFRDEHNCIGLADYNGVAIVGDKELVYGGNTTKDGVAMRDFVSGYPVLVEYGKKITPDYAMELNYLARRTAIGWNEETLFVVTVDAPGLKFGPLSDIFVELKADFAINLDGGGSTRLLVEGKRKTKTVYARPVDNVFCVYLDKPKKSTLYRVQVGAYKAKANAQNMKNKLADAGFTDSFITIAGGYYKVQLGAFGVRLNAERLADRLKAAGFSTMITAVVIEK